MTRAQVTAVARTLNGIFFLLVSTYGLLVYSPFAYQAFIMPHHSPALTQFAIWSPALYWLALLATIVTLLPQLRPRAAAGDTGAPDRGSALAWAYTAASAIVGIVLVLMQPLPGLTRSAAALACSLGAAGWPVWLAAVDYRRWPPPPIRHAEPARTLIACVAAGCVAAALFAAGAAMRMQHTAGFSVSPRLFAAATASSTIVDVYVFTMVFLVLTLVTTAARAAGETGHTEYWLLVAAFAAAAAVVFYVLVCQSLAFYGGAALIASCGLGIGVAAVWADVGLYRSQARIRGGTERGDGSVDAIEMFAAPLNGRGTAASAGVALVAAALLASIGIDAVREYDWNFLLQKLTVLAAWLVTFAALYAMLPARRWSTRMPRLAVVPVLILVLYAAAARTDVTAIDRFAAVDPSLRLIHDAQASRLSNTVKYYALLRSHTLLPPDGIPPRDIDFVQPLAAARERPPNIFVIVVDSLRRDYLSPYNAGVDFTPEIGKLAADSFVFRRALTRYAGTALSVPAIWAGGLVPHAVVQPAFDRRNTLLKLLVANEYKRFLDMDTVLVMMGLRSPEIVDLNPGGAITRSIDLCASFERLAAQWSARGSRPAFFYSLPQNAHMGVAAQRVVPPGESYPGFDARVASSVRRLDACVGQFVDFLKREQAYDDSVIVLTSDHGDMLGEEGRWGHAFWIYPEVMRVPLIVRVPPKRRAQIRTDLDAAVFSTDITPSLYALLGYEPRDLGPSFGRPFVAPRDAESKERRDRTALVVSSYGPVYGVAYENSRRLYVVDTVDGREYAYDLDGTPRPIATTPALMDRSRRLITQQLSDFASTVSR
ncbi:MAG TPA: sulfatase-like hydrolase/transferase [Vicinamibacterales bacterium]|nr:sulfatase-like hydrolase/transferase [Vicinamibacterales bacterium]